jgi:YPEH-like protein
MARASHTVANRVQRAFNTAAHLARLPPRYASPSQIAPPSRSKERCVHEIRCLHCDDIKSLRGMEAICLSTSERKFSTDMAPRRTGAPQHCEMVAFCKCLASEICCTVCGNCVGYVVVVPCSTCSSKNNNQHRYIFDPSSVTATELRGSDGLPATWRALPAPPWRGDICVGR